MSDYISSLLSRHNNSAGKFNMIENYLYMYHVGYNE